MKLRAAFKLLRSAAKFLQSAALASGLVLTLAGCETLDLTNLVPDSKKKLPGERREVFPGGVPGVSQGVPPELMKGYQAPAETAAAEEQKPAEPEKKPEPKPKPKPRVAKPTPTVAPEYQQDAQQPQSGQGQWPGQKPAQQSAWPQSPQPGTFSR